MIYFIRGKDSGNIKIGYSENPKKRQSNLQTAHYEELELMGYMKGTLEDEAKIHKMFSSYNIRGEWYRPSDAILKFIEENATQSLQNEVISLGDNVYRIIFSQPMKLTMKVILLVGTHDIRLLADRDATMFFGVEGKREILLDWLKSRNVGQKAIDEFALAMDG